METVWIPSALAVVAIVAGATLALRLRRRALERRGGGAA